MHVQVHVLFALAALFATRARARVVFTGSTFALLIFRRFQTRFLNHQSHQETLTQMLDNTLPFKVKFYSKKVERKNFCWQEISPTMASA